MNGDLEAAAVSIPAQRNSVEVPVRKSPSAVAPHPHGSVAREPSLVARLGAAMIAYRLDRQVDAQVAVRPRTMLAAHTARLTSRRERTELARVLRTILEQNQRLHPIRSAQLRVHQGNVAKARAQIVAIIECLESVTPIHPRGTARLRLILADGTGPLYGRRGTLLASLSGVLAAL